MEVSGDSLEWILSVTLGSGGGQVPDYSGKRKVERGREDTSTDNPFKEF